MKTFFALLLTSLALVGCKQEPKTEQECVITGQVFIRTKGGDNVKLGAVRVRLVPAALAAQREKKTETEHQTDISTAQAGYEAWKANRDAAEAALGLAEARYKAVLAERQRLQNILSSNARGMTSLPAKDRERVAEANRECMAKLKASEQTSLDARDEEAKAEAALTAVKQRAPATPDEMLALVPRLVSLKWPEAVTEAVTDAEGRFTVRAKTGEWALVASAVRPLPLSKDVEIYFWRLPVQAGLEVSAILSDANARTMTGHYAGYEKLQRD